MEYKDYYKVLEVEKGADQETVKRSYRRLARKYHPDFNKGNRLSEQRFKELNEAYQVLGDAEKRKKYDQLGSNWDSYKDFKDGPFTGDFAGFGHQGGGFSGPGFGSGRTGSFSDFFRTFFGNYEGLRENQKAQASAGSGRRTRRPGAARPTPETAAEVGITVSEAAQGTTKGVTLNMECPACHGQGVMPAGSPCGACNGSGQGRKAESIDVHIPAGVTSGFRVRVRGKGAYVENSEDRSDLFLVVKILPDPLFAIEGRDIHCDLPLSLGEAMLGAEIGVPLAGKGKVRMKIPPETQNGTVFRLKGKGLPTLGTHAGGDLIVRVKVVLPKELTVREKELFAELAALRSENPRSGLE